MFLKKNLQNVEKRDIMYIIGKKCNMEGDKMNKIIKSTLIILISTLLMDAGSPMENTAKRIPSFAEKFFMEIDKAVFFPQR